MAVLPLIAPEMFTPLSLFAPLKFLASPIKLIELVAALALMAPEKLMAFQELFVDAAAVPLMVSLLVTPATV
ncbi:MAG: hypothetical protein KAY21_00925, partial [Limnohabitans sp.]|nr:hypothetical protein [Limnohabitans sp.]